MAHRYLIKLITKVGAGIAVVSLLAGFIYNHQLAAQPAARQQTTVAPVGTTNLTAAEQLKEEKTLSLKPAPLPNKTQATNQSYTAALAAPARPDHCSDYDNMEAGRGHPENQHWFNHLDARGYARLRMACVYQWGGDQYACLDELWGPLESGWNHFARNPRSGAYGIPQALPGYKMGMFGSDWQTNPRTQVKWGLYYIRGVDHNKFHDPCAARGYRLRNGGY